MATPHLVAPDDLVGGWGWDDELPSPRELRLEENLRRVYDRVIVIVERAILDRSTFVVSRDLMCELHAIVMDGDPDPGRFRQSDNQIGRVVVVFQPPPWEDVERLVAEACGYINHSLSNGSPLHTAAYALWRINWIHPFGDGNGRTARALAYALLCVGFGEVFPGELTIDEQISRNPYPYWDALSAADAAWNRGEVDVGDVETLLAGLVERQIASR